MDYCVVRLFIEKLPKHPNYKNASKDDKQNTIKVWEALCFNIYLIKNFKICVK